MQPGLLPHRLNCPLPAAATAAMVRSTLLAPTASIGQVQWMVPTHGACSSTAAVPTWAATTARPGTLCVALRIDPFVTFDNLDTLPCHPARVAWF